MWRLPKVKESGISHPKLWLEARFGVRFDEQGIPLLLNQSQWLEQTRSLKKQGGPPEILPLRHYLFGELPIPRGSEVPEDAVPIAPPFEPAPMPPAPPMDPAA